jgi:hypothetical protein
MTIRQKLCEPFDGLPKETVDKLEVIADEFAIGFAEWLVIRYNEDIIFDEYTTKELLEIYKKQNK